MIQTRYFRIGGVVVALLSVIAFAPPAGAATLPPPEQLTCVAFSPQSAPPSVCGYDSTYVGSGGELHLALANKCNGPWNCFEDITLTGTFSRVVIERANQCVRHAICTIAVDNQAEIKNLRFEDKAITAFGTTFRNHCDLTAVCTKTQ